jgi:glycerol-3-phosphate acyltransferase PlsY
MALIPLFVTLAAYLLGSVPFAILVSRCCSASDPRMVGSGNVGATNVFRSSGVVAGLAVLLLDIGKGAGSVALAQRVDSTGALPAIAGLAAIVGHVYPVWLRFRGGKGVATACGVFVMLAPVALPLVIAIFAGTVGITRYVSLGSIAAALSLPPIAYAVGSPAPTVAASLAAAVLILVRHRSNLARLTAGTEPRVAARPGVTVGTAANRGSRH